MATQIDATPRVGNDGTGLAYTLAVSAPGGGVGIRVLIDETVISSKAGIIHTLDEIIVSLTKQTNPPS